MTIRFIPAICALGALAACGGGGGDDGGSGVLSTGLLTDVEVPSDGDLAGLPQEVQDLVADFVALNESTSAPDMMPGGTAVYSGSWGFGLEESDAVVAGDLLMTANFDMMTINGNVSNFVGDDDGTSLTIGNTLDVNGNITGTEMNAGVAGTLNVEGDDYDIGGTMLGAFGGANATTVLGTLTGTVTNPDASEDYFSGYFTAGAN